MVLESKKELRRWLLKESSLHPSYKKLDELIAINIENSSKKRMNLNLNQMQNLARIKFMSCKKLEHLSISGDHIIDLTVKLNPKLQFLKINCPNLKYLRISENNLETFKFTNNSKMQVLFILNEQNLQELKVKLNSINEHLFLCNLQQLKNPNIKIKKKSKKLLIDLDYKVLFYQKDKTFELYKKYNFDPVLQQKTPISKVLF